MRRTGVVTVVAVGVTTAAWLRLESPVDRPLRAIAVAALALLPAFTRPRAARLAAFLVVAVLGAWLAFDVSPLHPRHFPATVASRFANGFLDFYDVRLPFDSRVHAGMRGVVLAAVFGFALAIALAVVARRAVVAAFVLLVGAGWPATLRGPAGALPFGAAILLASLVLLAGLTTRRVPRAVLPAAVGLALAAVAASTSSAVAKGGLVAWQGWDFYNAPQPPVSVAYVWDAQYEGLQFPRKRTTVLEIKAPPRSLYWRAAVLDQFADDRWRETPPRRGDALEPSRAARHLLRQDVRVLALSDTRLVGASVPLRYDTGDAPIVTHVPGIATLPSGLTRGFGYSAWSYAPRPTPAQLAASKPAYPLELVRPGAFLDVWPGVTMPSFAWRKRAQRIAAVLDAHPAVDRYAPLARVALDVAGKARTPYAVARDLDVWFRSRGGFSYTNHPGVFAPAPLVGFVAQTRAGYCQYFAGAMALMLRYLGVPARVAVGFSTGRYDTKRGIWSVSDHDAHAWVEVWFRGYGWLPFDPTPAAGRPERGRLSAPYAADLPGSTPLGKGRARGRGAFNAAQSSHRHGEEGQRTAKPASPAERARSQGGSLLILLLGIVGAAVAAIVATKAALRRSRYLTRDPRRLAAACRRELADYLLDQRIEAARSATLHELGELVRYELAVEPDRFVAAAAAARFGRPAGAPAAARRARRELRALLRLMRRRLSARERVRGLFSLRSLGFAP